jgi:hypothetical protein
MMNLLIMNLSEMIHQGDIGATSKQLDTRSSQKVIGPTKLKCSHLISAGLASGKRQLRAKSIKLMPNN